MKIDNDLITQWEPKIQKMIIDLYNSSPDGFDEFEKEDIAQQLRSKIRKTAKSFDETKGNVFNTYLTGTLINTVRTLVGTRYRRYTNGLAFQTSNTIIGHDTTWPNAVVGGLITFFIGPKVSYDKRNPRGGGVITDLQSSTQVPIGPLEAGAPPAEPNVVQILTVDLEYSKSDSKTINDSYMALDSGTDPIGWNEVVEYSRYSIRVQKMPETISLDDVVENDEGEKIPSKILDASIDRTRFEDSAGVTRLDLETGKLINNDNLNEQEQLFLELRLKGFTMDHITKQLDGSAYKVRQALQEKFADLVDEYKINP